MQEKLLTIGGFIAGAIALGGLAMAFARTPPDDAKANLLKWADFVGVRKIPALLRSTAFAFVVSATSRVLLSILIFGAGSFFTDAYNTPIEAKFEQQRNTMLNQLFAEIETLQNEVSRLKNERLRVDKDAQSPSLPNSQSKAVTAVNWRPDFQLIATGGGPDALIHALLFSGTANSRVAIRSAAVSSEITGRLIPLKANIPYGGGAVAIDQIEAIPSEAQIDLIVEWKPPLSISDYLTEWVKFNIEIKFGDETYDRLFDEKYVREKLYREIQGVGGPRVTKKQG